MAGTTVYWQRLKEIVADAIDAPADQRDALVVAACGTDAGLVEEARALIAAAREAIARAGGAGFGQ